MILLLKCALDRPEHPSPLALLEGDLSGLELVAEIVDEGQGFSLCLREVCAVGVRQRSAKRKRARVQSPSQHQARKRAVPLGLINPP